VFAPGLIAAVYYRRRPTGLQIALGIAFTVVLSGLLGYIQDAGTSRVWENVALAIVLGVVLYIAILAYLVYVYFPKRERSAAAAQPPRVVSEP
jgi:ABC-type multidrug transport system permease subunit